MGIYHHRLALSSAHFLPAKESQSRPRPPDAFDQIRNET
jgi:hypothetical protein